MIIYETTKELFVKDVIENKIANIIEQLYKLKIGNNVNPKEKIAWKNSMQYMNNILNDSSVPNNSGIAIEFKIPYTSNRVDFIITGKDNNRRNTAIIIELKQWTRAEIVDGQDGIVKTILGGALREVAHPSYQAWTYASLIETFNETIQLGYVQLYPCAYLHNYEKIDPPTILAEKYKEHLEKAPLFTSEDVYKLREFILSHIK